MDYQKAKELLTEVYGGKLHVTESKRGLNVNCDIVGNTKLKELAQRLDIPLRWIGGPNYQVMLPSPDASTQSELVRIDILTHKINTIWATLSGEIVKIDSDVDSSLHKHWLRRFVDIHHLDRLHLRIWTDIQNFDDPTHNFQDTTLVIKSYRLISKGAKASV